MRRSRDEQRRGEDEKGDQGAGEAFVGPAGLELVTEAERVPGVTARLE
jgi:hypothetical protein